MPFEALYGSKPDVRHLRVLGCKCFVHIPKKMCSKFGVKAFQAIFVGYDAHTKGYCCYDVILYRIIINRDVIFLEHSLGDFNNILHHDVFGDLLHDITAREGEVQGRPAPIVPLVPAILHPIAPNLANRPLRPIVLAMVPIIDQVEYEPGLDPIDLAGNDPNAQPEGVEDPPVPLVPVTHDIHGRPLPRRSGRLIQRSVLLWDHVLSIHGDPDICHIETTEDTLDDIDLNSALAHPGWSEAMQEEYQALLRNNIWELTSLPPSRKAISSKWVLKTKLTSRPMHTRLKARVVARGLEQKYGIDFKETFALVVCWSTLRAILALAISLG